MPDLEPNVMDEAPRTEETQDQHEITETPEAETPETTQDSETEIEAQEKKGKGGFSKKINKLTARNYQLEETNAQLQARLDRIERRLEGDKAPAKAETSGRPDAKNFTIWEEYEEALADWKIAKAFEERDKKNAEETYQQKRQARVEAHNKRLEEAREKYPDFDELIQENDVSVNPQVGEYFLKVENSADVLYYLAQHREEGKRISEMEPDDAIVKIGLISHSLKSSNDSPATRPRSGAPAPYKPVGTSSTKSTQSLEDMPQRQYNELMNKRERERSGR